MNPAALIKSPLMKIRVVPTPEIERRLEITFESESFELPMLRAPIPAKDFWPARTLPRVGPSVLLLTSKLTVTDTICVSKTVGSVW